SLNIDHDDVLVSLDRSQRVGNSGRRVTRGLDHEFDGLLYAGLSCLVSKTRARNPLRIPTHQTTRRLGPVRIEIGTNENLQSGDCRYLGEKHRAKLAGADQRDTDRISGGHPGGELGAKTH